MPSSTFYIFFLLQRPGKYRWWFCFSFRLLKIISNFWEAIKSQNFLCHMYNVGFFSVCGPSEWYGRDIIEIIRTIYSLSIQPCSWLAFDKQNKNISCVCDLLANCVFVVWNSNGFICLLVFELILHLQLFLRFCSQKKCFAHKEGDEKIFAVSQEENWLVLHETTR